MSSLSQLMGGGSSNSGTQEFLTSGVFTVPIGVSVVYLTACGGGGGGGGTVAINDSYRGGGSGGNGGAFGIDVPVQVSSGATITVIIGAGGGGGVGTPITVASDGGNTSFGTLAVFSGGLGGVQGNGGSTQTISKPTVLKTLSPTDINSIPFVLSGGTRGGSGIAGVYINNTNYTDLAEDVSVGSYQTTAGIRVATSLMGVGGGGGGGLFGNGQNSLNYYNAASGAGANSGAGGGGRGGYYTNGVNLAGGSGGSGRLKVRW